MHGLRRLIPEAARVGSWPIRSYFFVLVAIFVAAGLTGVVYIDRQTDRDARRTAEADSRFAARTASRQLGRYLELVRASAEQLARNPQITQTFVNPAACSLTFSGVAGPDRSHIDVLRPDGSVACSSRPAARSGPARYRAWMGRALERPLFLAPTVDGATGARVAVSSSPIPGRKGAVAAFVDLASIGPELASQYSGGHPVEFLITAGDRDVVVARSIDPNRWIGTSLLRDGRGGRRGVERRDLDGTARLYAQAHVPGVGWTFSVGADRSSALAAASRLERREIAIIVVGLAAILVAAWLTYRNLVAPIRRLGAAVRSAGIDRTTDPPVVAGPAEVSKLSDDVNRLIAAVRLELLERQRAEARARGVLEAALDAVITIDHEGRIVEFNPTAEAMFGYRREDVVGAEMAELVIPPALREQHRRGFERYLATGEGRVIGRRIEITAVRSDGREFPIELAISRVLLDGPPVFTGYVRDISGQRHAEDQVRHLAAIVESSRDAIVGRTVDGIVTSWNAAAQHLFGYTESEIIGRPISILAPQERGHELDLINQQLRRAEIVEKFETVRVRKDGTHVEVESTVSPIMDREGNVVGASAISRDVTERKRVEADLRTSEARYRDLFENATDLIAIVDLESRFTAVNEAFLRTLGYSRDELIGRPLHELVPVEWHDQLRHAHHGKVADGVPATVYEHELVAKDGRRIQVEVASRLIEEDGRPIGTEAICRDVSERRLLEEQLRQSQKLESIGRLAGGIAHDFNNLLTVIGGYAEALLEESEAGSAPELTEIAAAAERATILTRQLLAFSRRQVLQPKLVSLNDVVDGMMPMLTRLIGEDIDLVTSFDPALPQVMADPNQIEQVLLNLVINARDAMPEGGKLTIETVSTTLDETYVGEHADARLGTHATLAVSDNGVGMDADTLARIFEPFFTTKQMGSGTGLGLSTVYGIVKQSGGNIWAYSEPGKGTTVKVYLPEAADTSAADRRDEPRQIAIPTGTETILIVEDEHAVRSLAAETLRQCGYIVLATGTPAEALDLADQHGAGIHLLLTDVVMPETNGRDLARGITTRIPGIRVLYMSGYADEAVTRNGTLEAGTAYLEKPFSRRDLASRVREVLDSSAISPRRRVA